jgi:membrane protein implicated in regulation of membrane protease activity
LSPIESGGIPLHIPRAGAYRLWVRYFRKTADRSIGAYALVRDEATEVLAFEYNLLKVTTAFVMAGIALLVLARYLPFLPVLSRIVHRQSLAAAHAGELTQARVPGLSAMAGRLGVAATPLRPAGRAEFGDQVLDVVTQGDFVEKGARVRIVEVRGGTVVVQPQREA